MSDKKTEMLDELSSEIEDIEGIRNRSLAWTIGLFSGLFIVIVGMIILLMAQKGALAPEYGDIGFKTALGGVVFYWIVRIANIFYRKFKNAKSNKGYERKHKSSDFDEEK